MKNEFNKAENNKWKSWCLALAVLSLYRLWFVCNGNTRLKWQQGCMVKVIINRYFLLFLAQKETATW